MPAIFNPKQQQYRSLFLFDKTMAKASPKTITDNVLDHLGNGHIPIEGHLSGYQLFFSDYDFQKHGPYHLRRVTKKPSVGIFVPKLIVELKLQDHSDKTSGMFSLLVTGEVQMESIALHAKYDELAAELGTNDAALRVHTYADNSKEVQLSINLAQQ